MPSLFHCAKLPTAAVLSIQKNTAGFGKVVREIIGKLI
jgi:hypothetical protein